VNGIVNKLNNRYLVAVIVLLFLVGVARRFVGR
jgi:hypothetical protein